MSTSKLENNMSVCANCGKGEESSINLKSCTACKLVKYCSRGCQIAHRSQHKKECKKRAKELHDEKLFKHPPPEEDCPICMIRLPMLASGTVYMACCGKLICRGCVYAFQSRVTKKEHDVCPFCRTPPPISYEERIKRLEKRMGMNDAMAISSMGAYYDGGLIGLQQNRIKALELWHRVAELGCALAYSCIGTAYKNGWGVEVDEKKAKKYWESAASGGCLKARHNLGRLEVKEGNVERALKHFMIAVRDGNSDSLQNIKHMCKHGFATKEDYAKALQFHQTYVDEIKSDQRDEAVAYKDEWKYY